MALSALIGTSKVSLALAHMSSGSTIVLPLIGWFDINWVVVVNPDWCPWDSWIEIVLEVHVTVTDGLIASTLV
jgi:hypothetical protein